MAPKKFIYALVLLTGFFELSHQTLEATSPGDVSPFEPDPVKRLSRMFEQTLELLPPSIKEGWRGWLLEHYNTPQEIITQSNIVSDPGLNFTPVTQAHFNLYSHIRSLVSEGKKPRVLDVGAASGWTSLICVALGAEVTALDPYDVATKSIKENIGVFVRRGLLTREQASNIKPVHNSLGGFVKDATYAKEYDLVFCNSVIYAVVDPLEFVNKLKSCLRSGGRLMLLSGAYQDFPEHSEALRRAVRDQMDAGFLGSFQINFLNGESTIIPEAGVIPTARTYKVNPDGSPILKDGDIAHSGYPFTDCVLDEFRTEALKNPIVSKFFSLVASFRSIKSQYEDSDKRISLENFVFQSLYIIARARGIVDICRYFQEHPLRYCIVSRVFSPASLHRLLNAAGGFLDVREFTLEIQGAAVPHNHPEAFLAGVEAVKG